jgi:ferredoxin
MARSQVPGAQSGQTQVVLSGSEAVAKVESAICGGAVVGRPAVAEGLAMAGHRAASMTRDDLEIVDGVEALPASCVHHTVYTRRPEPVSSGAFELVASTVQEAVDHCLVAHLMSRRLGRTGVCSMSPDLTGRLDVVHLPADATFVGALEEAGATLDASEVLDLARESFRLVGTHTGRSADVVEYRGAEKPEVILVGAGTGAARARLAADALVGAGIPVAAVSVFLVRPFPTAALRQALGSAKRVLVVDDPAGPETLHTQVEAALSGAMGVQVLRLADDSEDLLAAVSTHLPDGLPQPMTEQLQPQPPRSRILVAPAGPWADVAARQIARAISHLGGLRVACGTTQEAGAVVLQCDGDAIAGGTKGRDLLLASHPSLLEPDGPLGLLAEGAQVVTMADAASSTAFAEMLDTAQRALVRDRGLQVSWIDGRPPEDAALDWDPGERAAVLLAGAAMAALRAGDAEPRLDEETAAVADRVEAEGGLRVATWLREGAAGARRLDAASIDPSRPGEEQDFRAPAADLQMPEPEEDPDEQQRWRAWLRGFHLRGQGAFGTLGPAPGLPVQPAVLEPLAASLRGANPYPFALVSTEDGGVAARSLRDLLAEGCEAVRARGRPAKILDDNRSLLVSIVAALLREQALAPPLGSLLEPAGGRLIEALALKDEPAQELQGDLDSLTTVLPEAAPLVDLRPETPAHLFLRVLDAARAPLHQRFLEKLRRLREQLADLLLLDRLESPEGGTAEAMADTLGTSGTDHIDPQALSQLLTGRRGHKRMEEARRQRIEQALALIEGYLDEDSLSRVVCVRPPDAELSLPETLAVVDHSDPLAAALGLFDGLAKRMAEVFRAARTATLEAEHKYVPEVHGPSLAHLDWEGFTAEELEVVPAVVVLTTGRRLRERDQGSLSALLRSSRPVHVVACDRAEDDTPDLSTFHISLGNVVLAHREAFAVQSSLARPDGLVAALARMATALRPSVAVVAVPTSEPAAWRILRSEAGLHGRAFPEFTYDPDAGESWAERFDLSANPQPERQWPAHPVGDLELSFTFADSVALEPTYLGHFRVIPPVAWGEDQIPLAEYLDHFDPESGEQQIPFVWVVDAHHTLQRAVVTRELALACRDRLRAWRFLQELGGYDNAFANQAAARAREQALAEAEMRIETLQEGHATELQEARTDAAREALERLAASLMDVDALAVAPVAARPAPAAGPPEEAPPEEAEAPEPEPEEEEEALVFDEPFIDSPLCTTCNECTNINPNLFKYNADKQAFLADLTAGTFAELVKAAKLCPARCIHPGKPRDGDATATPELIEQAAEFN